MCFYACGFVYIECSSGYFLCLSFYTYIYKLWERVIERMLQKDILILENQFCFMPGRLTTKAIYLFRRLMRLYRNRKVDLGIDMKKSI